VRFGESDLAAIAAAREIRIETQSAAGTVHRTIIWVAEMDGVIYIRSVDGADARWYREATSGRPVAVHVAGRRLPVKVDHATDHASIEAASAGLQAKYRRSSSLQSMLMDHTLETTLRVDPDTSEVPA
jgi:hypothetical protein